MTANPANLRQERTPTAPFCRKFGAKDDRGAVTAFATVFTVAVLFVFGLVYDGGRMLAAQRQADNEAAGAARAAAQAIAEDRVRAGETTNLLDVDRADDYVCQYLGAVGRTCDPATYDLVAEPEGARITVRIRLVVPLRVLPGVTRTIEGVSTACNELGTTDPIVTC
jgi:Flp pilus assembly protein TadG